MDAVPFFFRPFVRTGGVATALAFVATLLVSSPVAAATVIGQALGTVQCGTGIDTVQMTSAGASYAVPAGGGAITDWSTQAGPSTGPTALLVWRPTTTPLTYTLVGESPLVTLTANTLNTFTLSAPIAVQAGDLIGLRLEGQIQCVQATGNPADSFGYFVGPTPAVGASQLMAADPTYTLNVSATVGTVAPPPPPPPPPSDENQCQGDCVSTVNGGNDQQTADEATEDLAGISD